MTRGMPVILVGGWGLPPSLIAPLLSSSDYPLTALALEQVAADEPPRHWLERQLPHLPERAVWIGWSLGGQLAMLAARLFPDRVAGVATLCSSPCFVTKPGWSHAMAADVFEQFRQGLLAEPRGQWQRFLRLQVHGDRYQRVALRTLSGLLKSGPGLDVQTLVSTLVWLQRLDQRELWRQCRLPRLHLWGEQDQVCLWQGQGGDMLTAHSQTARLAGMAHWPGGPHVEQLKPLLANWLGRIAA